MGESFATILLFALTIGLAAPLIPYAARLARRSLHGWKDVVLVAAITALLLYVTYAPASLLGVAVAAPMLVVGPLLSIGGSNIGQGAIAFLFVWVGAWAVGVFCAACLATAQLNAWWDRRSG
jgi:hypothetical protein